MLSSNDELARLHASLDFAGIGLYEHTLDGTIQYMNQPAIRIFNLQERFPTPADVVGRPLSDVLKAEEIFPSLLALLKEGVVHDHEIQIAGPSGEVRWVSLSSQQAPGFLDRGDLIQVVVRDVTRERETLEAMRRGEEKYRGLVQAMGEGLGVTDEEENITFANDAFAHILGYDSADEIMGKNLADFSTPAQMEAYEKQTDRRQEGNEDLYEAEILRKDGEVRTISISARPLYDSLGRFQGTQGLLWDVTDRKKEEEERARLQEQLLQSQKMEAVGQLAAGVAHDFNNILGSIGGYAELSLLFLEKDEEPELERFQAYLANILTAVRRAKKLTQQMLGFSRQGRYNPKIVDMNHLVQEVGRLLEKGLSSTTPMELEYDLKARKPVTADETQLHQVVSNLTLNAKDAMPQGGTVRIATENATLAEPVNGSLQDIPAGSYARLSVSDQGTGIEEEDLARIFDPFFSTKDKSKGSGLGLAVVWGIVENHGGFIDVDTGPGRGTTFHVYLPTADTPSGDAPEEEESKPAPRSGKGSILLVDDELAVRTMLSQFLGLHGYEVATAANGEEGLEAFRKGSFDLVITDLIMSPMDGSQLFHSVREIDPEARVLIISGYQKDEKVQDLLKAGAAGFLSKPFTLDALASMVSSILPE